jgi:two-component system chemotaxis response regulator CheB
VYGRNAVGILLTGLGRDGVEGCKAILAAGGLALGQDAPTSVIYGPSKVALDEGALSAQVPLDELPGILQDVWAYRDQLERARRDAPS